MKIIRWIIIEVNAEFGRGESSEPEKISVRFGSVNVRANTTRTETHSFLGCFFPFETFDKHLFCFHRHFPGNYTAVSQVVIAARGTTKTAASLTSSAYNVTQPLSACLRYLDNVNNTCVGGRSSRSQDLSSKSGKKSKKGEGEN